MWLNGLALVTFGAFIVFAALQAVFGWQVRNEELAEAGLAPDTFWRYLGTGHFGEATFENWESEFLQMGSYVLLTAYLVQRGSAESRPVDGKVREGDEAPADSASMTPVRRLGYLLYRNSLSLVLFALFFLSMLGHLLAGTAEYNEQQALRTRAAPISAWQFLGTPDFWFQSMQNWQSEFVAIGCLVVLGIVLRQHGSPESKPVAAPHRQTG
jgi:hypothetical protein